MKTCLPTSKFPLFLTVLLAFCFSACTKDMDNEGKVKTIRGTVNLFTQKSIDSFVALNLLYDRLAIEGSLIIGRPGTDIHDLSKLSKVVSVTDQLGIWHTKNLLSLNGLQNIPTVGHLYIEGNEGLTDLSGLDSLKLVLKNLFIEANSHLTSLDGLDALTQVVGDFKFNYGVWEGANPQAHSLKKINLPNLKTVGGEMNLTEIYSVTTFDLPKLESVMKDLVISNANSITDFSGFDALRYLGSYLQILGTSANSFKGFNNLEIITGALHIIANPNIRNMQGFDHLRQLGHNLEISANKNLASLEGLQTLGRAHQVIVNSNPSLIYLCPIKPLIQNVLTIPRTLPSAPDVLIQLRDNHPSLPNPTPYDYVINNCP